MFASHVQKKEKSHGTQNHQILTNIIHGGARPKKKYQNKIDYIF